MVKLYRYRPISEFLFKELFYQEIYFASYNELNDPLDLTARIEFSVAEEGQIDYLIWFILKTTVVISQTYIGKEDRRNNKKLDDFNNNKELKDRFKKKVFEKLTIKINQDELIWLDDLECILQSVANQENIGFRINFDNFKNELLRLTTVFLKNSYSSCFSEKNDNFLMWSHYASSHTGICLEFSLEKPGLFPYISTGRRKSDNAKYLERLSSNWQITARTFWDRLRQVSYKDEQPFINFFYFSPVFDNESNCDLIGLTKGWTHEYAQELEWAFSTKTKLWQHEKEWRAIQLNFGDVQTSEERIRHYPIEALSSIYFGMRTSEDVKKRISSIYKNNEKEIKFYDCKSTNGKDIEFQIWDN